MLLLAPPLGIKVDAACIEFWFAFLIRWMSGCSNAFVFAAFPFSSVLKKFVAFAVRSVVRLVCCVKLRHEFV